MLLDEMRTQEGRKDPVSAGIQVQLIFCEVGSAWPPVLAEEGGGSFKEHQSGRALAEFRDQCVGGLKLVPINPAEGIVINSNVDDRNFRQALTHLCHEGSKIRHGLFGRVPIGEIIPAGEKYDLPRGVGENDPVEVLGDFCDTCTSETAVEHGVLREILRKSRPHPNSGTTKK